MPQTSRFVPKFRPTINKLDTSLYNEGGYRDSNFVRFWKGQPQVLGGWSLLTVQSFVGAARAMHAWRTKEGKQALSIGTSKKLYAVVGGVLRDITPNLHDTVLTDAFTTENGSAVVTVYVDYHRLKVGDTVVFSNHQSTVGGLTIEGTYTVTEVLTVGRFTITHGSNATSDEATPTGGNVDFVALLPEGLADSPLTGYGSGTYSSGPYGAAPEDIADIRDWSLDNWGENLMANPSGYGLFEFQAEARYTELAFNGDFDGDADGWALGTDWSYASNAVSKTAGTGSNLSQDVSEILEGGRTYVVEFDVTRSAGTLKFRVNAGTSPAVIDVGTASAAISKSGTYRRVFLCPADPQDIVFEADSAFAGSVDNVSYKLYDKAYRLVTAPPRIDTMFVDPRGLVVALGTVLTDGSFSATGVRNSALGNNRTWVPDTDNIASEYTLRGGGGRLMQGIATRQQNIVWGDGGVFSLQYTGAVGAAYDINLLGTGCGLMSRHAASEQNGFVFWMANTDKFFIFRGVGATNLGVPEEIPCPIREDIFENLDRRQVGKIYAGINASFSEVWFFYPDTRDGNENSRCAVMSWTQRTDDGEIPWVQHQLPRTAWQSSGTFDNPVACAPPDANGNGYLYTHESGYTANGAPLNEYIETAAFNIGEGDKLLAIMGIVPDFADQTGNLEIIFSTRSNPQAGDVVSSTYTATPSSERINTRVMARQARMKITGTSSGAFWRLGALALELMETGARR